MRKHYFSTYLFGTIAVMAMAMGQSCQSSPSSKKAPPCEKKMNDDGEERGCPEEEANGEASIHVIEMDSEESSEGENEMQVSKAEALIEVTVVPVAEAAVIESAAAVLEPVAVTELPAAPENAETVIVIDVPAVVPSEIVAQ